MTSAGARLVKRATGIPGLDSITGGGLPEGGATLVLGAPACGKTVLGLQICASAIENGDGAVFVSFEESRAQVQRDAASFRWGAALVDSPRWTLIDARPRTDAVTAGGFDIQGLLAAVDSFVARTGAGWVVLDGIDLLLRREPDALTAMDQVREIANWSEQRGLAVILTGKLEDETVAPSHLSGIEFLLPTIILLSAEVQGRRLTRRLRIAKYRGSAHVTDELPLVLDDAGVHLPYAETGHADSSGDASTERISTGIPQLDKVLGGGLYRGSTALLSGQPGTTKTTLAASFAAAAGGRAERALFVSFDELQASVVRNVGSVGIDLRGPLQDDLLRFCARESWTALAEEHFLAIQRLIDAFDPACLVIDPVSALLKASGGENAQIAVERLVGLARARGITTLLTSLAAKDTHEAETTLSQTSTLADTWIVLDYHAVGGERNRSLSVVKSRGSAHSNQVRELVLSADGVGLAEVYEYGSEVLMGTARAQKQREEAARWRRREFEREQARRDLERRVAQAENRLEQARLEAEQLREELAVQRQERAMYERERSLYEADVRRRRDPKSGSDSSGSAGLARPQDIQSGDGKR